MTDEDNLSRCADLPRAVVVHAGARDNYQLARAMDEAGLLDSLVTNVYSAALASERYNVAFGRGKVTVDAASFACYAAMRACSRLDLHDRTGVLLGRHARRICGHNRSALFACSYTASEALKPGPNRPAARFLFQLHPHPLSVRDMLMGELERVPIARSSLLATRELKLGPQALDRLASEPSNANGWAVASTYTARTLQEHGVPAHGIHVVPYGVDAETYPERATPPPSDGPLQIMFLGSMIQHKGLSYLLEAVRRVGGAGLRVLLRGRGAPDAGILASYRDLVLDVRCDLPTPEIVRDLHQSHLFVLPSLVEGFGHVILQAMSCGVPVLATDHTCAADVITEGVHGFVVQAGDPDAIAERLLWCLDNRHTLDWMGREAARQARSYTWERFRSGIREAYASMHAALSGGETPTEG